MEKQLINPYGGRMKLMSTIAAIMLLCSTIMSANIVKNGDFEAGTANWKLGQHNNAVCNGTVEKGVYVVSIKDACVQEWSIQLTQIDVPLVKGTTYKVSFDAWSTEKRDFKLNMGMNGAPYTNYTGDKKFEISKKKTTQTYEFTMTEDSNKAARVEMNLGGGSAAPVYIDNIVIEAK